MFRPIPSRQGGLSLAQPRAGPRLSTEYSLIRCINNNNNYTPRGSRRNGQHAHSLAESLKLSIFARLDSCRPISYTKMSTCYMCVVISDVLNFEVPINTYLSVALSPIYHYIRRLWRTIGPLYREAAALWVMQLP